MKILITGAGGQVGQELLLQPAPESIERIGLTRKELDISQPQRMRSQLAEISPGLIINAAAYTQVDSAQSERPLALSANRDGVVYLARACRDRQIPLIHLSTDFVFDGELNRPYKESDPVNPLNYYATTKWLGEEAIRKRLSQHIIMRVSWVFGPRGKNFFSAVPEWIRSKEEMQVVSDQIGGPTPAEEIASALLNIVQQISSKEGSEIPWGTYHFGGVPAVSRFEYTQFMVDELRKKEEIPLKSLTPVPAQTFPMPAPRPAYSALDSGLIEEKFGIKAPDWRKAATGLLNP